MASSAGCPFRQALRRLTGRVLLLEWLGTLVCALLALAWLHIADSHVWQFVMSILLGAVLVIAFLWLQITVFRRLRSLPSPGQFWKGFLICVALSLLWLTVISFIGVGRDHAQLYAGYWNSKLSPGGRNFFTFERLADWQQFFWDLVQWILAALLLPIAIESSVAAAGAWRRGDVAKRIGGVYRRWLYWLAAIVFGFAGSSSVGALINWKPGSGIGPEIASTVIRALVAYSIVVLLATYMLSLAAVYLGRAEPGCEAPEPAPVVADS